MISGRTRDKIALVGKLAKPSDLGSEDVVGSTPTRGTNLRIERQTSDKGYLHLVESI